MYSYDILTKRTIAEILSKTRVAAGKTQKDMAIALNVSKNTINNWEAELGGPDILQLIIWLETAGVNPMRAMLDVLFPSIYLSLTEKSLTSDIRKAVVNYMQNIATDDEIRKIAFNIFGDTGSSWHAQLDMLTAHNHTCMRSKIIAARLIADAYKMERNLNKLKNINHILPDIQALEVAIVSAQHALMQGSSGYNLIIDPDMRGSLTRAIEYAKEISMNMSEASEVIEERKESHVNKLPRMQASNKRPGPVVSNVRISNA